MWWHNMPPSLQVDNIFAFIHQVAVLFRHKNIFMLIHQVAPVPACRLFKTSATSWPFTFWPWKWCLSHVGYHCDNFCLPRPLCSWVEPDVRDRQTDVRQEHRLMPPPYGGKGVINTSCKSTEWPMWNAVELKTKCLQACLQCIKKTYKGQIQLDIAQQVHTSHTNPSCSNKRRQRHNKHWF